MSERNLGITGAAVLAVVVIAAVLALRVAPRPTAIVPLEDLPVMPSAYDTDPSPADCEASGGEVRYVRNNQCFSEPDVHDVCGFGVPCFDRGDGYRCVDVKDPYCACADNTQCPDGWTCNLSYATPQCVKAAPVPLPKPLHP